MPCRCDYMEPTAREIEHKLVHNLIFYVVESLHLDRTDFGNNVDQDTKTLCSLIKAMNKKQLDTIVYNGRNAQARKLADWWDKHQEYDKLREAAELHQKHLIMVKERALKKLTKEERQALGIK